MKEEKKLLNDAKSERMKLDDERQELANTVIDTKKEESLRAELKEAETLSH